MQAARSSAFTRITNFTRAGLTFDDVPSSGGVPKGIHSGDIKPQKIWSPAKGQE
jgi:hypothetical protein